MSLDQYGDSYDETLETHVKNCAAFLLFVTANSINSLYIEENEIPWALRFQKPIIKCITDEEIDYEIEEGAVAATVSPEKIEPALQQISGLTKGEPREAKGISVVVDPSVRGDAGGDGYAYCLYADENAATAQSILLEARNSGCSLYDAVKEGEDDEKQKDCASLIVVLDKAFLSDAHLSKVLIDAFQANKDIAVCLTEDVEDSDLPQELVGLHKMQWLNFVHGITPDMNKKLARHLQKRGCRNTATLPGFYYEKTSKGIVIERYTGTDPNPRIESHYGGVPVTKIQGNAFKNCLQLQSVRIFGNIETIGDNAFENCTNLTAVTLPDGIKTIAKNLFRDCTNLISVAIPDGVTSIEDRAFFHCAALTSVTIPDSVTKIGFGAFEACGSLTSVIIPDSVTKIDMQAYKDCTGLTAVTLPDRLKELPWNMFEGCTSLAAVTIPDSVTEIGWEAFRGCTGLTVVTIPNSVRAIGAIAFAECSNLSSITIPDSVEKIDDNAFDGCTKIVVTCSPGSRAWQYC